MLPHIRTFAAWPVWRDSTTKPVRYQPMTKRTAGRLLDDALRFERQTRQPGHQDGAIGRNGLAVLRALLSFLNWRSGALYPSWEAIASKAAISKRSVGRGLAKLKAAGLVNWLRRCEEVVAAAGGFLMRQISNAYAVVPSTQWKGYRPPPAAQGPAPGTWGDQPPADPYGEAKAAGDTMGRIAALEAEAGGITAIHARVLRHDLRKLEAPANSEAASPAMKPQP